MHKKIWTIRIQKQNIQNSLNEAFNTFNNADADSMEGQAIRQEEQAKMDQYKEAISSRKKSHKRSRH